VDELESPMWRAGTWLEFRGELVVQRVDRHEQAGSYVSESNYFNKNWGHAFWGPNHARLKAVKRKYDPEGLFFVHHGVGSDE
jgi:FAD/FMN-containing dehydrogenase